MKKALANIVLILSLFVGYASGSNDASTHITANKDTKLDLSYNKLIYGERQINAIKYWGDDVRQIDNQALNSGIEGITGLGELFTFLQNYVFAKIFLAIIILVPLAFLGHNLLIGKRHYNHDKLLNVFSKFNIYIHWLAAVPFVILCITGLMMVFGSYLGGGALIRFARDAHGISTIMFAIFAIFMFLMWVKDAVFRVYDIKWMAMLGGYLDKENKAIPAGKFNAGQKMWFWVATIGGFLMVLTGALLFFQIVPINTLRLVAIAHNVLGFLIIAFLITHIYMAVFAIEGAVNSILNGKMSEEELSLLHSIYYKQLQESNKLSSMRV